MKKIKYLLLISIIFLTGCTCEYNITINNDLSVSEEVNASETIEYFANEYKHYNRSEALDNLWEYMSNGFDYASKYKYNKNDNNTGIILTNNYDSFIEYKNETSIYNQYFDELDYEENDDIITIEAYGFNPYVEQDPTKFAIDNFKLNITLPFKVLNSNADSINDNTYTWIIDKNTDSKRIYLQFDKSSNNSNLTLYVVIGTIFVIFILGTFAFSVYVNYKNGEK